MGCPRRTPWTVLRTPVCFCILLTSFTSVSIFSVCCYSKIEMTLPLVKSLHSFLFFRYFRALWSDPVDPADEGPWDGQVEGLRVHRLPRGRGRQEGHGTSQRIRAGRPPNEGTHSFFIFYRTWCCGPVTFWQCSGSMTFWGGSMEAQNMWVRWIRIRNTAFWYDGFGAGSPYPCLWPITNRSGSGSCYFRPWPSRR